MKVSIIFVFSLLLVSTLCSQNRKTYLSGNIPKKLANKGVEITDKAFDSLLVYTQQLFETQPQAEWDFASCVAAIRITNTIRLKHLYHVKDAPLATGYKAYYDFVYAKRDSIWFVICPEAFNNLPLLNYRSFKHNLEWETFPNFNSIYAVLITQQSKEDSNKKPKPF